MAFAYLNAALPEKLRLLYGVCLDAREPLEDRIHQASSLERVMLTLSKRNRACLGKKYVITPRHEECVAEIHSPSPALSELHLALIACDPCSPTREALQHDG